MGYLERVAGLTFVGLFMGVFFAVISLFAYLFGGGIETVDGALIPLMVILLVQVGGGLVGGFLAGLLSFLRRWIWGQAIIGIGAVTPSVLAVSYVYDGSEFGSETSVSGTMVISVLVGVAVGIGGTRELQGILPSKGE